MKSLPVDCWLLESRDFEKNTKVVISSFLKKITKVLISFKKKKHENLSYFEKKNTKVVIF